MCQRQSISQPEGTGETTTEASGEEVYVEETGKKFVLGGVSEDLMAFFQMF